jgi:ABC-type transporter Mla subunit MlaD
MAPPAPQPPLITRLRDGWRLLLTVGSLLLGASLVIALLVYTAYRRGVFEPQLQISVRVPDARGLRPGSRVLLSGLPVGALRGLEMQADGQVMLHLRVSVRYRGVVSPASSVRITQDLLIGDQRLTLTAAPRPASAVPDRFLVAYSGRDGLEDLLARGQLTLQQLDRLLDTVERLAEGEVAGTLAQLRGSLRSADALVGTLEREAPPTAAVLRQTGREAGSTVREVRLASSELVRTLVQVRPALSRALLQVDDTGEQAQTALIWLNQLIDRLDPGYRLRRQGPQPRPDAMAPESGPPAVPAPAAPTQSATP